MHLSAALTAAFWTLEPFGEIGAIFSLQLSSRTRFDKINKKKVIAENQCKKHKKSSLDDLDVRGKHDFSEFGGITDTIISHICSSSPL